MFNCQRNEVTKFRTNERKRLNSKKVLDQSFKMKQKAHILSRPQYYNANISRRSASLITQLFIGHVPLNKFLKTINKVDSARCPACGAATETVTHFLLVCPGYAYERCILGKRLSGRNKALTLRNLLGDDEATVPLANYIRATHRLSLDA